MDTKNNILEAIGNTPLVRLNKVVPPGSAEVYAKCEYMNPAGSIKDRMAWYIIDQAEKTGLLKPGGTIVENTSGNTGMGAAMAAAAKGYKAVFTMPDKMSKEKIDGLRAFGAQVIITPTDVPGDSPDHYVNVAKRVAAETPNSFYLDQYHNQWNIEAHEKLTGEEIYRQTDGGQVDAVIAGTGTGGTISGIGRCFKKHGSKAKIIGVDPLGSVHYSIFYTGQPSTPYVYKVEGLGEDIVCRAFDPKAVDEMHQVNDYECFTMARRLIREEGLFCGGSSGGMVHVACKIAQEMGPGKKIVVILPDSGTRYVTKYLDDAWMKMHGFLEEPRGLGNIEDMIDPSKPVVTAKETDSVGTVIALLRDHGISQVPVTDAHGKPAGLVHEIDILRGLQRGKVTTDSPVKAIENKIGGIVSPKSRVEELYGVFAAEQAAIVMNEGKIIAVLSEIDLIEHLARHDQHAHACATEGQKDTMHTNPNHGFGTRAIHAGQVPDPSTGAICTPIYQTSTFVQKSPGVIVEEYDYSRAANPTRTAFEANIASLEGAKHGLAFSSGVAATGAVIHLLSAGDHVVLCDDVYGGTNRIFHRVFQQLGIQITLVDMTDAAALKAAFKPNTKLVWVETPTNPMLKIIDIAAVCAVAKQHNAITCVDNTFCSPYLQNPLALGADIVCHSTTKYIGGHSDAIGGVLACNDTDLYKRLKFIQLSEGAVPGIQECFLFLRSTKTLHVRMDRHCANAMEVAKYLEKHAKVQRVIYPGLESHPQHAIAKKQMRGFGGMITIYLTGGLPESRAMLEKVKIFALAESLGGVESLIEHPAIMTHASVPADQRAKLGIADNLVRLSVGIEDVKDLIADLEQALG